jgi:excisionase family DNA binding protein
MKTSIQNKPGTIQGVLSGIRSIPTRTGRAIVLCNIGKQKCKCFGDLANHVLANQDDCDGQETEACGYWSGKHKNKFIIRSFGKQFVQSDAPHSKYYVIRIPLLVCLRMLWFKEGFRPQSRDYRYWGNWENRYVVDVPSEAHNVYDIQWGKSHEAMHFRNREQAELICKGVARYRAIVERTKPYRNWGSPLPTSARAMSTQEAATYLGTDEPTIWGLIFGGELPSWKFGKRSIIDRQVLDEVIERKKHRVWI